MKLNNMDTAPKDGTHIIIKGNSHDCEHLSYYEAWWWKPTELHQWEAGARPHWETICNNSCLSIHNPMGWIAINDESET